MKLKEQLAEEYDGNPYYPEAVKVAFKAGFDAAIDLALHELHIVPRDEDKPWQWDYVEYVKIDPNSIKRLKEV